MIGRPVKNLRGRMWSHVFLRSLSIISVIVLITLLFYSCALEPYWRKTHAPLEIAGVIRYPTTELLRVFCGNRVGRGCTERIEHLGIAILHLGPDADECTLKHEKAHAAGWMHDAREIYRRDCGPL